SDILGHRAAGGTTTARVIAISASTQGPIFTHLQFTPDLMPSDILGHRAAGGTTTARVIAISASTQGPIFTHL
ncbi:AAA family ATPase, partial [Stenotrophomonas maltophilia]